MIWVTLGLVAAFLVWDLIKKKEQLAAMDAWSEAQYAFVDWRLKNPGVYIGLSEEGRRLLSENLKSFERFLRTHPFIKDGESHREWLISLFDDYPPNHPQSRKPAPGLRLTQALFYLSKMVYIMRPRRKDQRFTGGRDKQKGEIIWNPLQLR